MTVLRRNKDSFGGVINHDAVNGYDAAGRNLQAGHRSKRGGFPTSGGSEQSKNFPRFHRVAYFVARWTRHIWILFHQVNGRATSELQSLMRISYAVFCLQKNMPSHTRQIQRY